MSPCRVAMVPGVVPDGCATHRRMFPCRRFAAKRATPRTGVRHPSGRTTSDTARPRRAGRCRSGYGRGVLGSFLSGSLPPRAFSRKRRDRGTGSAQPPPLGTGTPLGHLEDHLADPQAGQNARAAGLESLTSNAWLRSSVRVRRRLPDFPPAQSSARSHAIAAAATDLGAGKGTWVASPQAKAETVSTAASGRKTRNLASPASRGLIHLRQACPGSPVSSAWAAAPFPVSQTKRRLGWFGRRRTAASLSASVCRAVTKQATGAPAIC